MLADLSSESKLSFPMSSTDRISDQEAFEQGFHGIPDPQTRAKMSPEKLAIELSKQEKDSPPYILLEHELNLRLAKEQSIATRSAGWYGAVATIVAVFIGYFLGSSQCEKSNSGLAQSTPTRQEAKSLTPSTPAKNINAGGNNGAKQTKP